jgi:hypothetical protein
MPRPRFSISISPALHKRLERERWRRKARSMSALIESLLWQALDQSDEPARGRKEAYDAPETAK